jgi:hypothetical protein
MGTGIIIPILNAITETYAVEYRLLCASDVARVQLDRKQTQISFYKELKQHSKKSTR